MPPPESLTVDHPNPVEKVGFDEAEEQPLYKQALMTATAEGLTRFHLGKGLIPADEADDASRYGIGFRLMAKSPLHQGGMARPVGDRRENESE